MSPAETDATTRDRWPNDDRLHAWWVEPRRLLAGAYPGAGDPHAAGDALGLLLDAGVRTLVDLTTPDDGLAPYDETLSLIAQSRHVDARHERLPIPDLGVVDDGSYDTVLSMIDDGLRRGAVFVHCWGGIGRTATVVGCWLVRRGATYDEAIAQLAALRGGTRSAHRRAPESDGQHDVVRRRASR